MYMYENPMGDSLIYVNSTSKSNFRDNALKLQRFHVNNHYNDIRGKRFLKNCYKRNPNLLSLIVFMQNSRETDIFRPFLSFTPTVQRPAKDSLFAAQGIGYGARVLGRKRPMTRGTNQAIGSCRPLEMHGAPGGWTGLSGPIGHWLNGARKRSPTGRIKVQNAGVRLRIRRRSGLIGSYMRDTRRRRTETTAAPPTSGRRGRRPWRPGPLQKEVGQQLGSSHARLVDSSGPQ